MITRDRAEIGRALDAGAAVVLPMPTPLPYVVAGTDPAAVNAAKGRPPSQPTGLGVVDFGVVEPWLALDPPSAALARRLTDDLLLNLFLPVSEHAPDWLRPASATGLVGVTTACAESVRPLLESRGGHLALSSANRTGEDVAVRAAQADAQFDGRLLVLDGDDERDPSVPCGSAAIVVVRPGGELQLSRGGVQSAGRDPGAFLEALRRGGPLMRQEHAMGLTAEERLEIHEVIALHGHLTDAGAYERFAEVFTSDMEVDAVDLGRAPLPPGDPDRPRLDHYIDAARRIGPGDTLGLLVLRTSETGDVSAHRGH